MKDIYSDNSFVRIPILGTNVITEEIIVNVNHIISFFFSNKGYTTVNITNMPAFCTSLTPNQIAYLISFDQEDLRGDPDPTLG